MTRKLRKRHLLLLAALVALAAVVALKAYGRGAPEPAARTAAQAATLTVSVEVVRSEAITASVSATATVAAWQEATIGAE
ncbi:efflux transporter periplasmic adaptor subunit, partial [Mesorhizobium sp. M4A.F.Ca.ET.050.02.1.1]